MTLWTKPGNPVGRVTVSGLEATGVYRAAFSVENWGGAPITNVILRNIHAEFDGGGAAWTNAVVRGPGVDVRPLPAWGLYARNVRSLVVEDVRFSLGNEDFRPVLYADGVEQLRLDGFNFSRVPGVNEPMVTTNVAHLSITP